MKIILKKIFFISCLFILFARCTVKEPIIQNDKEFNEILEISRQQDRPFCIILTDSTDGISRKYLESLTSSYTYLTKRAVFNFIDISSNKIDWYIKWLAPASLPLTCVFSRDGKLIDLIPGAAKESFLYAEQAIKDQKITGYHWPNKFQQKKASILPLLNQLLDFKENMDIGKKRIASFKSIPDSLSYPYLDYVLFKTVAMNKDTVSAIQKAHTFLALESADMMELYKEEFIEAKKMINPGFRVENAPNIRTNKEKIILENLKKGQIMPINIVLYNDGIEPLKIEKINMSCSCVSLEGPNKGITIMGKKSHNAKFYFKPENEGNVLRDIYVSTNALNTPNLHISIVANVKP